MGGVSCVCVGGGVGKPDMVHWFSIGTRGLGAYFGTIPPNSRSSRGQVTLEIP